MSKAAEYLSKRPDYLRTSFVIHGPAGTGKTWLSQTVPGPRLVLDAEGGVYDVPFVNTIVWDPLTTPDFGDLSPEDTVVASVETWDQFLAAVNYVLSDTHPFESVILDSYTEIQKVVKDNLAEERDLDYKFQFDDWGALLNRMEKLTRHLQHKTRPNSRKRINLVLVCGTDDESGKAKFLLQGALRKHLPYWLDMIGYLVHERNQETGRLDRVLHLTGTAQREAKCRAHAVREHYGESVPAPDLTEIIAVRTKAQEKS